jgi:Peptidase family M1 domain/Peptidase M1 N-terminal domain
MKRLIFSLTLLCSLNLFAQDKKSANFTGFYQVEFYPTRKMKIAWENNKLSFELVGQGKTVLELLSGNTYKVVGIPNSTIEFIQDSLGKTIKFVWNHNPFKGVWARVSGTSDTANSVPANIKPYLGKYAVKGNGYQVIQIFAENDHLVSKIPDEVGIPYYPATKNNFIFKYGDYQASYEFVPDKKGIMTRINSSESGPIPCIKIMDTVAGAKKFKHNLAERRGFTLADTLQGTLSSLRSCYDVLFYDLNVTVDIDAKSIRGSNGLRFRAVQDFSELQIDLFANMKIEKILFHNDTLAFTRKFDAVFIRFPQTIKRDARDEIQIFFSGKPQLPDITTLSGGFFWVQDLNGKPWIEVVTQGAGASLWWPCKDHLSDKPDSMHMTVTVPSGLTAISNGQLVGKSELPDKQTRFQWAVHYPMNTYSAVLYIGDYVHVSDVYDDNGIRFPLNYYYLPYNAETARKIIGYVKPMLSFYQKEFGPYPFSGDGYALVESPYGMEHQSAVSVGSYTKPDNQKTFDFIEMQRILWHESAHEWWGNSVTCSDYADFWIHESFASYAEVLCKRNFYGKAAEDSLLLDQPSDNILPIIGYYGVNDFHMGDMYTKGTRMIATLRCVMNNDSLFFNMLRGLQKHFAYQSISTKDVVEFINSITGSDHTYLFDQYLKYPKIPVLNLSLHQTGSGLDVRFQWKADVADFRLPVKVSTGKDSFFINPTTEWKTLHFENTRIEDFHLDQIHEYYNLKME